MTIAFGGLRFYKMAACPDETLSSQCASNRQSFVTFVSIDVVATGRNVLGEYLHAYLPLGPLCSAQSYIHTLPASRLLPWKLRQSLQSFNCGSRVNKLIAPPPRNAGNLDLPHVGQTESPRQWWPLSLLSCHRVGAGERQMRQLPS